MHSSIFLYTDVNLISGSGGYIHHKHPDAVVALWQA